MVLDKTHGESVDERRGSRYIQVGQQEFKLPKGGFFFSLDSSVFNSRLLNDLKNARKADSPGTAKL